MAEEQIKAGLQAAEGHFARFLSELNRDNLRGALQAMQQLADHVRKLDSQHPDQKIAKRVKAYLLEVNPQTQRHLLLREISDLPRLAQLMADADNPGQLNSNIPEAAFISKFAADFGYVAQDLFPVKLEQGQRRPGKYGKTKYEGDEVKLQKAFYAYIAQNVSEDKQEEVKAVNRAMQHVGSVEGMQALMSRDYVALAKVAPQAVLGLDLPPDRKASLVGSQAYLGSNPPIEDFKTLLAAASQAYMQASGRSGHARREAVNRGFRLLNTAVQVYEQARDNLQQDQVVPQADQKAYQALEEGLIKMGLGPVVEERRAISLPRVRPYHSLSHHIDRMMPDEPKSGVLAGIGRFFRAAAAVISYPVVAVVERLGSNYASMDDLKGMVNAAASRADGLEPVTPAIASMVEQGGGIESTANADPFAEPEGDVGKAISITPTTPQHGSESPAADADADEGPPTPS